jgi:hypothetical protein
VSFPRRSFFIVVLSVAAACGGSDASGPKVGPAANMTITMAPFTSAVVGTSGGTMTVVVADAAGTAVPGATVTFTVSGSATVSPSSATTDASGTASTTVTMGTLVGSVSITASVGGSAASASSQVLATPGPVERIVVTPKTARLFAIGDTVRLQTTARDQYSNGTPPGAVSYASADPTLVSVDASGLVRVVKQGGTANVVVSGGTHADTAVITVLAAGATPCTGIAAPSNMNVGDVVTFSGTSNGCLSGTASGAEFALVAFNSSSNASTSLSATVTGSGLGTSPSSALLAGSAPMASSAPTARGAVASLLRDESFHLRLQARAQQELRGKADAARAWFRTRGTRVPSAAKVGTFNVTPSFSRIPSAINVGDVVRLNVNPNVGCSSPTYHGARVMWIGTKSIVLADTLNPSGGFTSADYQRFADRFDTIVYPMDTDAFGVPSDIDANGRVAILFTRAVNELTPAKAGYYVGGFFYERDLYPATNADPNFTCPASNEGEMFYMLVPDPNGTINGNVRRTGFVDSLTTSVIAHEFQHLINASHRLYVNTSARYVPEATWLNEGLSHVAEELLYYREAGKQSRVNLSGADVYTNSRSTYPYFKQDAGSNFSRLISYLQSPGDNSPIADNDSLATRGATWSFLRYAVDQLYPADGAVWSRFDNSTTSGLGTLQSALGPVDLPVLFRNWALANYLDDTGFSTDARFAHKSWNFRSIYGTVYGSYDATGTVFTPMGYPLKVTPLADGVGSRVRVLGTSASYYRLAVDPGREALVTFANGGVAPDPALQFVIVRTK